MIGDEDRRFHTGRNALLTPEALDIKPSMVHESGRTCNADGCAVVLSVYNEDPHCWQHRPVEYADLDPRLERARRLVSEGKHDSLTVDDYVLLLRDKKEGR